MVPEWLYGRRVVVEALRGANRTVEEVWIDAAARPAGVEAVRAAAVKRGVAVKEVARASLAALELPDPRGVAARCGPFGYRDESEIPAAAPGSSGILVVLDHLEDPQNTGAILRTAEAAGCIGACIPKRRAAQITPAVARASSGASEHLPVFRVGNVAGLIGRLQAGGYWVAALDGDGDSRWNEVDYRGHVALVVGAEGRGVQRLVRQRCDFRVALPMLGRIGSLNAGAAFAAVVYEATRQQGRARS